MIFKGTPEIPFQKILTITYSEQTFRLFIQRQPIAAVGDLAGLKKALRQFIQNHPPEIRMCRDGKHYRLCHYNGLYSRKVPNAELITLKTIASNEQVFTIDKLERGIYDESLDMLMRQAHQTWVSSFQPIENLEL